MKRIVAGLTLLISTLSVNPARGSVAPSIEVTWDGEAFAITRDSTTLLSIESFSVWRDPHLDVQTPLASYGAHVHAGVLEFRTTGDIDTSGGLVLLRTTDPLTSLRLLVTDGPNGSVDVQAIPVTAVPVTATGVTLPNDGGRFLGLGERSDGVDFTGRVIRNWAEEGPFSAGGLRPYTEPVFGPKWQGPEPVGESATNYPVPWVVSSNGWGFLLDSTWENTFDMTDGLKVRTQEPELRFSYYRGDSPKDVLQMFTADVGRQPDPAEWFFGPWVQTSEDPWMLGFREQDVPVTVSQTYTHYLPCAAHAGRDEASRVNRWHEAGYKITTYVNSFVCYGHPGFEAADRAGYFIKTRLGTTYPIPYAAYTSDLSAVVDFTAPGATEWWQSLIGEAVDDGYDGWMEDFGEYVPPDSVAADGRSGVAMHNAYCDLYHRASDEYTRPRRGDDFAQFVRCGYTDTAKHARLVWGGDPTEDDSEADGLAAAVSQGVSMGLSGVGYWGSDIGGFHSLFTRDRTDAKLQARWLQFGAFSGVMRTQQNGYPRPGQGTRAQVWDPETLPIWRKYTKLRTQLFPYIWDAALQYQDSGLPLMRHLGLEFPNDPNVWDRSNEYEFMFGDDLLVAPIVDSDATTRNVYLPEGEWIDFNEAVIYDPVTGDFTVSADPATITGGQTIQVSAGIDEIPLFVRAGACIPMLPADVDTLADTASESAKAQHGLVTLNDRRTQLETLAFGSCA